MSLALLAACAMPMPPSGGPSDEVPPTLAVAVPESASTGHGAIDRLEFEFSEKMTRTDAYRWLTTYPRRTIRSTGWSGARSAQVRLEEPLPADTVIVVEVAPGMQDSHGVPQPFGYTYVFATGDSIYDGELSGDLVLEDVPLGRGVVEIVAAGPDSVRLEQRPVLRRAVADSGGHWVMPWLPADGEGWLLRAYEDGNDDRRAGENESQRIWPDTLRLVPDRARQDVGVRLVYRPTTPGRLVGRLGANPGGGPVLAHVLAVGETDTGYVAAPSSPGAIALAVTDTADFELLEAGPGLVRAVFFVDLDADSLFSAVGDTADTLWSLEPWALVDSIMVDPGLPTTITWPAWPDTLTPWPSPIVAEPVAAAADSLAETPADSSTVAPESGDSAKE